MQVAHRKRARTSTALAANAKLSTITGDPPNATKHQTSVTETLQTPPNLENSSSSSCSKEELTYKDVRPLAVINHGLADKRLPLRNPAGGGRRPGAAKRRDEDAECPPWSGTPRSSLLSG